MNKMKNYRTIKKKSFPVLALVLVAVILGGALSLIYLKQRPSDNQQDINDDMSNVNLSPPTNEEVKETEQHKQDIISNSGTSDQQPGPTDQKKNVTPIIGFLESNNEGVRANGYVSEVIESGGICTLTLEKQGQKVSVSKKSLPDAQSTICGLMVIERGKLSAGEWKATITYSSPDYQGVSGEQKVQVN